VAAVALVRADRQRMRQVLLNLVSNAIKYNVEDGTVTVAAGEPRPGTVRVTVTDTGPGISTENLELIFAPFERLGAERTTVEGTGIGLALSRRLAEAMEGTLAVESRPGRGSTFWVELPAALDAEGVPIPASTVVDALAAGAGPGRDGAADRTVTLGRAVAGSGPARSLVLCIDDNDANLKVVEASLARLPWIDVVSAGLARVGVDLARQHRPDLVLLDLHLPDLTGEEVLRMLRNQTETAQIPVVIVSADATPGAVRRLLDQGAQAYLTKPLDVRQLIDCVRQHVPAEAGDRSVT
jgi:CheY-like chemotaxis protein/anti-sigma regulatory factor (Ser/Thr protein kinase)